MAPDLEGRTDRRSAPPADQWARASELFLDLADLEASERDRRMAALREEDAELAGWVEALLAEDPGADALPAKRTFGHYVEVQRIGSGGMGEVFLAHRDDGSFERQVAVKLLRAGMEGPLNTERFLRERRTLAALEHESIVRLLDGGTTEEGRPYLVMEYVDGEPLDEFMRQSGLDLRARLHLFCRVLDGVAYAHERGVVHRDLKPTNVLVRTDGAPRIVDFGIARVEAEDEARGRPLTRTGARMYTPEYASPEQVLGQPITSASDVFSLGVMLYRLICDRSPWPEGATTHRIEQAVVHSAPVSPSRVARGADRRQVRGDLDTVVLKCLDPDPERRYPDARTLRDDLERLLGGQTVRARRIGAARRGARWFRRHPWRTAALVATVVALASSALIVQAEKRRAAQEEELRESEAKVAEAEKQKAEQEAELRASEARIAEEEQRRAERREELRAALPERLGSAGRLAYQGHVVQALREVEAIEEDFAELEGERLLEFGLLLMKARIAIHAVDYEGSLEFAREARALVHPDDPKVDWRLVRLGGVEGNALAGLARYEEAEEVLRETIELAEQLDARGDVDHLGPVAALARVCLQTGRVPDAIELLEAVEEDARARGIEHDAVEAEVLGTLGRAYVMAKDHRAAVPLIEHALDSLRWHLGTGHKDVAELLTFLGEAQMRLEQIPDALETLSTARRAYEDLDLPKSQVYARDLLAQAANAAGDYDLALEVMRENQATIDESLPESRPYWFMTEYQIAYVLRTLERYEESREAFERALSGGDEGARKLGNGAEVQIRLEYAALLERLEEPELAREQLETSLELWEAEYGPNHPMSKNLRARLGS